MGLFTSYSAENRRVDSDTAVSYSMTRVTGEWKWVDTLTEITETLAWEFHRFKQKTYRYVGMTKTAADACAAAMVTAYTRDFKESYWAKPNTVGEFSDRNGGSRLMADVAVVHMGGQMYDVVISISEDDARLRKASATPSTLFTLENQRTYDA